MSFHPLSPGFNQSLLGAADPLKFSDPSRQDINREVKQNVHTEGTARGNIYYVIAVIVISVLIFVAGVSIYDVIRNAINNYYASIALNDPKAENTKQSILSTEIANKYGLISSIVFSGVCIVSSIILTILIIKYFIK